MGSDFAVQAASLHIGQFYNLNATRLNESMLRVSSGKRMLSPSDNAIDYFRSTGIRSDIRGMSDVKNRLAHGIGLMKVAEQTGSDIWNDLQDMKVLIERYYQENDPLAKDSFVAQFDALKGKITQTITAGSYDGHNLISDNGGSPFMQIVLDPRDITHTLDIGFDSSVIVDVSGLTLGVDTQANESNALQAQVERAGNYIATVDAYLYELNGQFDLAGKKSAILTKAADNMTEADMGAEMMKVTKQSISQDMSLSMLAQANMIQSQIIQMVKTSVGYPA